jgi:D-alanyl-D-alanine carboxypeptidase
VGLDVTAVDTVDQEDLAFRDEWEVPPDLPDLNVEDLREEDVLPTLGPILEESLHALLMEYLALTGDTGIAVALRKGDGAQWAGAAGLANRKTGQLLEPHMGFRVGSNTKPLVATLVMMLTEEGLLELEDSVVDYLPEYAQWADVTLRDLLAMQSGIPDYLVEPDLLIVAMFDPASLADPRALVAFVEDIPVLFGPGEGCVYSNTNYILLGLIIELVTGNSVEEELTRRIIDPLDLRCSYMDTTGEPREDLAHGYLELDIVAPMFGVSTDAFGLLPRDLFVEGMLLDATYLFHPSVYWAAGALVSCPEDMVTFMRALFTGELVSPESIQAMKKGMACSLATGDLEYGLGIQQHETHAGISYGHGGLNFGYRATTLYQEGMDLTFSHMQNTLPHQAHHLQAWFVPWLIWGLDEVYEPCLPPDGFFTSKPETETLHVAFGGDIFPDDVDQPIGGMGFAKLRKGSESTNLYGFGTGARLEDSEPGSRVTVEYLSPPAKDSGAAFRLVSVSLSSALLVNWDGWIDLGEHSPDAALAAVADVFLNPFTWEPFQVCFTGVSDPARSSRLFLCKGEDFLGDVGNRFKMFGEFAVESAPEKLETLLDQANLPHCVCRDSEGDWNPCL